MGEETLSDLAMFTATLLVSLTALLIAGFGGFFARRDAIQARAESANKQYVEQLEKRVEDLQKRLNEYQTEVIHLRTKVETLTRENVELRIKLLEVEGKQ